MFYNDKDGREIIIYTKKDLRATQIESIQNVKESIWIEIQLNKIDKLIAGCVYRSPNSNSQNNENMINILKEIYSNKHTQFIVMAST